MGRSTVDRKLAAIMATDVAAYSRLMAADETGTLAAFACQFKEVVEPRVAEFGGRVFNTSGDGAIVEFSSAVSAVECAVAIQREMADRNATAHAGKRIEFRIGVNLGDVIIEGGDLYGNGVNLAARLQGAGTPGGIALSQVAFEQCRGNLDLVFADLGELRFKNIPDPVRVWAWSTERTDGLPSEESTAVQTLLARPAIAVVPFVNMSGEASQDYFADGVTEEVITALARWREFPVIARNSSFTYRGHDIDVVRAAKELGARYVLEGSVRCAGQRVRVTAQLIDGDSGHHVWAEPYDRDLVDFFALQDEITEKVATEVAPALRLAETRRVTRKPPESLDAWGHYLRGLNFRAQYTAKSFSAAEHEFEAAIRIDPNFAAARAELAIACVSIASLYIGQSNATLEKALFHAQRAIELDEGDAAAHTALGFVYTYRGQAKAGVAATRRAVALNPNLPLAWYYLAIALMYSDDLDDALEAARRAIALGPQEAWLWTIEAMMALANYLSGHYAACIECIHRSRALRPATVARRRDGFLVAALAQLGRRPEAKDEAAQLKQRWPDFGIRHFNALPLLPRQRELLDEGLMKAGLTG